MIESLTILINLTIKDKFSKIFIQNILYTLTIIFISTIGNLWIEQTNIYLFIFQDKFCCLIILLTLWVFRIIIIIININKIYLLIILLIIIVFTLCSSNILTFYIIFEIRLIPLFIIIFWWGKTKERTSARIYILMYTIMGSLPLLITLFILIKYNFTLEWDLLINNKININSFIIYWNLIIAFLVKIPVYGFHSWLPKAHVEAPVFGSIILARVILKLGSIGLIRTLLLIMNSITNKFNSWIIIISIIGIIFIRIICITQLDLKIIVAYSSVVHIGVAVLSIITLFKWGISGAILLIIAHGLCSSLIFYIVNTIYERSHSRIILFNKGVINTEAKLTFLWFFACIGNIGAPISINFISELLIINRILSWLNISIIIIVLINIFRRIYCIQLFIIIAHGSISKNITPPVKISEFLIIILHIIPMNFITFNSWMWILIF